MTIVPLLPNIAKKGDILPKYAIYFNGTSKLCSSILEILFHQMAYNFWCSLTIPWPHWKTITHPHIQHCLPLRAHNTNSDQSERGIPELLINKNMCENVWQAKQVTMAMLVLEITLPAFP